MKKKYEIWVAFKHVGHLHQYSSKSEFMKGITYWTRQFKKDDTIKEVQILRK